MKKSIVTLIGVGVFILLCALTLRPVNTPENENELLVAEGELTRVFEGTGNDIIFKLKDDDRNFYINRGLEQGLSIKDLQAKLTGKQITLKFPKHWTLLDPRGKTKHLSVVRLRDETVFSELNQIGPAGPHFYLTAYYDPMLSPSVSPMTQPSKISYLSIKLKENPVRSVFIFVLVVSVILALAQLYKSYLISTGYDRPTPLMAFPIIFQHTSFTLVPLLFALTWRLGGKHKPRQVIFSTIGLLIFTFTYLFISNALEWYALQPDYGIRDSYPFVIQHSGPGVVIIYLAIATVMILLGMERVPPLSSPQYLKRIVIRNRHKNFYIAVEKILFIEASDNYISVYTEDEHPELVRQTIGSIEMNLDPSCFQRIHRSHIINLKKVKSWETDPNGGYLLHLSGGHQLKMSKSYRNKLELLNAQYQTTRPKNPVSRHKSSSGINQKHILVNNNHINS